MTPPGDRLDPEIVLEQLVWNSAKSLDFYRRNRQSPDDLYRSERFFLPAILPHVRSMLDVGCAAGGFLSVARSFNPTVRYVGVDIVPAFVAAAAADHPDAEFLLGDGLTFESAPGSFELVHASGVLHLNLQYPAMIGAMWQQTRRFLLCDLRLTHGVPEVGRMDAPFGEEGSSLPYVVLHVDDAVRMFSALNPAPERITIKGYPHAPAGTVTLNQSEIVMAFVLAEKGVGGPLTTEVDLDG